MDRKRLFSIILVVFIDLLGFSLILPLLPYYAKTFAANSFVTGLLVVVLAVSIYFIARGTRRNKRNVKDMPVEEGDEG